MPTALPEQALNTLAARLSGPLHTDHFYRTLYATDASAYRELPLAVAIPENTDDLRQLLAFARQHGTSLIPRTAGTSLAGQVVGPGIVVDLSRHFTGILELNAAEGWVRVQPGVVRDELNLFLKPHGLFFGPETSTANRAMIGGMVGNNSCGSNSVVYGSTREHLLEVTALLADGTEVVFGENPTLTPTTDSPLERAIYEQARLVFASEDNREEIFRQFPKKSITRRNTGYALDLLAGCEPFTPGGPAFNFCRLIAGSEGTLCLLTAIKLHLSLLPPPEAGLLCVHFDTIDESLRANVIAMQHRPSASELIDHYILACTKENLEQRQNRFFVHGDPGAILVVEFRADTPEAVARRADALTADLKAAGLGTHFPLLTGADTGRIWALRKAGLGLLANLPGDEKAVAVIEDTAVDIRDLPAFIREFNHILSEHDMTSVHYAHAGSGELHLRPILNLKTAAGHARFRLIAREIARLVKKYDGSLSGEHGDGRLRGEFIPLMVGPRNYALMQQLKQAWDPQGVFNPGKIVNTPPMDTHLRYEPDQQTPDVQTFFRFEHQNILQHAEQCNGSGDCRKPHSMGGTMCPSFMATRDEADTTRGRANMLREVLTNSPEANRFDSQELKRVMDLCLLCKACKAECPSNVDVAKLKMEFMHQYHQTHKPPLRDRLIGHFHEINNLIKIFPWPYNFIFRNKALRQAANRLVGFHPDRSIPLHAVPSYTSWWKKRTLRKPVENEYDAVGALYLFVDEFTNFIDAGIGSKAVLLLESLGYRVYMTEHHAQSGRPLLSKGMLDEARKVADFNVEKLVEKVSDKRPLVGIEPSAILSFRDEYPDLVSPQWADAARQVAAHTFTFEEFISREIDAGRIRREQFVASRKKIMLHGHCQQKAVSNMMHSKKMLTLPEGHEVQLMPTGCCGMAGGFGYEAEHYELSMKIGELVLLPEVRKQPAEVLIAAAGTSCRHQIYDGTGRRALHPIEILYEALRKAPA